MQVRLECKGEAYVAELLASDGQTLLWETATPMPIEKLSAKLRSLQVSQKEILKAFLQCNPDALKLNKP